MTTCNHMSQRECELKLACAGLKKSSHFMPNKSYQYHHSLTSSYVKIFKTTGNFRNGEFGILDY